MSKNKKAKKMKEVEIEDEKSNEEIIEISTKEKINQLETEVLEFKDKLLRKAAEFENYKRRTENDQMNLLTYAAESFIKKLLPVVDDFERSLQHIEDAQDIDAIKQGIKLIYDKLMKIFQEQGVIKIDSVGKHFDVDYHEALMQRADDSVESHTVLDELEKGYTYNDKVIRHAKVIVSEEKSSAAEETENDEQSSN